MPVLKIDNMDLFPFLRVAPGEGFDPFAPSFLTPEFAESAVGEGDPVVSVHEGNKEQVWPLHLTPDKTPSYADSKDGMHQLVIDLNKAIASRSGGHLVSWQDDGATDPTYHDLVYAKWEPDFNYRRAQKRWVSGNLRVWTKPYGHTGTIRSIGIATSLELTAAVAVSSPTGDVPALLDVIVGAGSYVCREGRIYGISVVPSGYKYNIMASAFTLFNSASLWGASGAAGSQSLRFPVLDSSNGYDTQELRYAQFGLSPATMYQGRHRLFGIVSRSRLVTKFRAYDTEGNPLGPPVQATAFHTGGYHAVDLGVLDVDATGGRATIGVYVTAKTEFGGREGADLGAPIDSLNPAQLNRILVFPEDSTAITVHTGRTTIAEDVAQDHAGRSATLSALLVDRYGNSWNISPTAGFGATYGMMVSDESYFPKLAVPTWNILAGARLMHPEVADMLISAPYDFGRSAGASGAMVAIGKVIGSTPVYLRLMQSSSNPGSACLNIITGGLTQAVGGVQVMASVGITALSGDSVEGEKRLEFYIQGGALSGAIRYGGASVVASIGGAGFPLAAAPGQALMGGMNTGGSPKMGFRRFSVSQLPSSAIGARERIHFNAVDDYIIRRSSASNYLGRLESTLRGGQIPQVPMDRPYDVVGFVLPLEQTFANDFVSTEVRVRERFTYAR